MYSIDLDTTKELVCCYSCVVERCLNRTINLQTTSIHIFTDFFLANSRSDRCVIHIPLQTRDCDCRARARVCACVNFSFCIIGRQLLAKTFNSFSILGLEMVVFHCRRKKPQQRLCTVRMVEENKHCDIQSSWRMAAAFWKDVKVWSSYRRLAEGVSLQSLLPILCHDCSLQL